MQTSVAIHPITQFPDGETIPPELSLMQGRALTKWEEGVDLALGDEGQFAAGAAAGGVVPVTSPNFIGGHQTSREEGQIAAGAAAGAAVAPVSGEAGVEVSADAAAGAAVAPVSGEAGVEVVGAVASDSGFGLVGDPLVTSREAGAEVSGREPGGNDLLLRPVTSREEGAEVAGAVPVGGGVGDLLELVYAGKHSEGRFDVRLVNAAAELIRRDWKPSPPPEWVTYIRSLRCPFLMPDYAERLASALGLPCLDAVAATRETEPQKAMPDVHRRYENVVGLFDVLPSVRLEPVLLLDDIVSSRWTLTSAGMSLRKAGVAAVHPFVLADFSEMAGACRSAAE